MDVQAKLDEIKAHLADDTKSADGAIKGVVELLEQLVTKAPGKVAKLATTPAPEPPEAPQAA